MLREIIEPKVEEYNLRIPREYLNRKVEILVLPYDDVPCACIDGRRLLQETSGILSKGDLDPVQWQRSMRSEWGNRL
ncbi:hypothetical protein [Desulfurispira natronophila]|uniref:Uncharacterized protein n=1 Tax=Desulfurispira natronophila TaxID=682562 RepID=A0A7W7Y715_9BACT|nr:hypothetical protein [Desulfurispira natronophila]MBB5022917.1 hypothetical protein [Desulfurispira natronophila]